MIFTIPWRLTGMNNEQINQMTISFILILLSFQTCKWKTNIVPLSEKCLVSHFPCSSVGLPVDDTMCLLTGWERLTLCAVESGPARAAPALPIVGTALGSVVTVTRVETIRAPVPRGTGCRRQRHSQAHCHTTCTYILCPMHAHLKYIKHVFEGMPRYIHT